MSFQSNVDEYAQVEQQLKDANAAMKALRDRKSTVGSAIMTHMLSESLETVPITGGGKLALKTTVQLGSMNKEYIQETLTDFFKQPQPNDITVLAEKTAEALMTNREAKNNHVIKILKK